MTNLIRIPPFAWRLWRWFIRETRIWCVGCYTPRWERFAAFGACPCGCSLGCGRCVSFAHHYLGKDASQGQKETE